MELKNFFAQNLTGDVIPSPTVYLYQPGTTTLATNLKDANGAALSNPFTGTINGQIQLAAPDGDYDLRITGASRDFTMRVRFIDSVALTAFVEVPIADYTALRAYTGGASRLYVTGVLGTVKPAGIAGTFEYDPSDTTSADNGGTIIVDASGKRWKRIFDGEISVLWFGAKGNGVADDTAAIQAAINSGKSVFFPAGTYNCGSAINFTCSNVMFFGAGSSSVITSLTQVSPVVLGDCSNLVFANLYFQTSVTSGTESVYGVIKSENAALTNIVFDRCFFSAANAATNGVKIINEAAKVSDGIYFRNCRFENIGRMGVEFQNHAADTVSRFFNVNIQDCTFKNIGLSVNGMGVSLSGYGRGCNVSNNTFDNCRNIAIEGVGVSNSTFSNNKFKGFGTYKYAPFSFTGSLPMVGNVFTGNEEAEDAGSSGVKWIIRNSTNIVISENVTKSGDIELTDVNKSAIVSNRIVSRNGYAIYLEGTSSKNRISYNYADNTLASSPFSVIRMYGASVTKNDITENVIEYVGGTLYDEASGATNNRFDSNRFNGNVECYYSSFSQKQRLLPSKTAAGQTTTVVVNWGSDGSWRTRHVRLAVTTFTTGSAGFGTAVRELILGVNSGASSTTLASATVIADTGGALTITHGAGTTTFSFTTTSTSGCQHFWDIDVTAPGGSPATCTIS